MQKMYNLLKKILRGDDVLVITQSAAGWEKQFKEKKWERLLDAQPNTQLIATLVRRIAQKTPGSHVLDLGCGNGALAVALADDDIRYTGIDISKEAIARAKEVAPPTAHFLVAPIGRPGPELEPIDILVCNEVLYYVEPRQTLAAYRSRMSSEGVVVVSIVSSWRSFFLWRRIKSLLTLTDTQKVTAGKLRWDVAVGRFYTHA